MHSVQTQVCCCYLEEGFRYLSILESLNHYPILSDPDSTPAAAAGELTACEKVT